MLLQSYQINSVSPPLGSPKSSSSREEQECHTFRAAEKVSKGDEGVISLIRVSDGEIGGIDSEQVQAQSRKRLSEQSTGLLDISPRNQGESNNPGREQSILKVSDAEKI